MNTYSKMLPHLENGSYDYDFWNAMRGNSHNDERLAHGKDTSTGAFHMSTMSNDKYMKAVQKESIFRQLGTCITTYNNGHYILARDTTDLAEWVPEGETIPMQESVNDFTEKSLGSHKLTVFVKTDEDFIHDATFDFETYLTNRLAKNFGRAEEKAFITGTGKNMPTGILADKDGADIGVTAKSITYDDVVKLYFSVKPEYRKHGVWMMNDETAQALRTLKDDGGNYIWNHTNDTIMGKRVIISEFMPSAGSGAKPIAFGDFHYYWMVNRRPVSVRCLIEMFVLQDQVGHLAFEFLDGKLVRNDAIKVLQMTANYEAEQHTLEQRVAELRAAISAEKETALNADHFLTLVRKYTEIPELTAEIIREFVEKVYVYKAEKVDGHRVQRIKIVYNCIGEFTLPDAAMNEKTA